MTMMLTSLWATILSCGLVMVCLIVIVRFLLILLLCISGCIRSIWIKFYKIYITSCRSFWPQFANSIQLGKILKFEQHANLLTVTANFFFSHTHHHLLINYVFFPHEMSLSTTVHWKPLRRNKTEFAIWHFFPTIN